MLPHPLPPPLAGMHEAWVEGRVGSQQRVPVFWALTKATLLVCGSRRMKPHSLCMGLRVSRWKALNLDRQWEEVRPQA